MSDANMIFVSRNDMVELLEQAFEEGWNGYLDLRDATAERLLEKYLERKKEEVLAGGPESSFVIGVNKLPATVNSSIQENVSVNWVTGLPDYGVDFRANEDSSFVDYRRY
jgi:hypothetical protein